MEHGKRGQEVLDWQCGLARAGVYTGDLDGCWGPVTAAAAKAFQSARGLTVSGIVDGSTAAAMGLQGQSPVASLIQNVSAPLIAPLFPGAQAADLQRNLPLVLNALLEAGLGDPQMIAMALATIRVETQSFLPVSEQVSAFNTSAGGKPFDLYNSRPGLGNTGTPDGERFRGRGFVQLTGRANYTSCGKAIGLTTKLVDDPLLAHDAGIAAKLLAHYLKDRQAKLRSALDSGDGEKARRLVNGGDNGRQQFEQGYQAFLLALPKQLVVTPRIAA